MMTCTWSYHNIPESQGDPSVILVPNNVCISMLIFLAVCVSDVSTPADSWERKTSDQDNSTCFFHSFYSVCVCVPGSCQQIVCLFMTGLNHVSIKMLSDSHRTELGFFLLVQFSPFELLWFWTIEIHNVVFLSVEKSSEPTTRGLKLYIAFSHLEGIMWFGACSWFSSSLKKN